MLLTWTLSSAEREFAERSWWRSPNECSTFQEEEVVEDPTRENFTDSGWLTTWIFQATTTKFAVIEYVTKHITKACYGSTLYFSIHFLYTRAYFSCKARWVTWVKQRDLVRHVIHVLCLSYFTCSLMPFVTFSSLRSYGRSGAQYSSSSNCYFLSVRSRLNSPLHSFYCTEFAFAVLDINSNNIQKRIVFVSTTINDYYY